jgi:hypothetical protein
MKLSSYDRSTKYNPAPEPRKSGGGAEKTPLDVTKSEAVFDLTGLAGGVYFVRCVRWPSRC